MKYRYISYDSALHKILVQTSDERAELTWFDKVAEIQVAEDKVNDGGSIGICFVFEHVAFFHSFAIVYSSINFRERKMVDSCPFLSQQYLLQNHIS